jgi:hypothetical protein
MRHRGQNYGFALSLVSSATLVTLKLTGVIDWSWWVVTSPLWFPTVLMVVGLVLLTTLVTFEYEDIRRKVRDE